MYFHVSGPRFIISQLQILVLTSSMPSPVGSMHPTALLLSFSSYFQAASRPEPRPQPAGWRKPPSPSSPPAPSPAAGRGQILATRPTDPLPSPGPGPCDPCREAGWHAWWRCTGLQCSAVQVGLGPGGGAQCSAVQCQCSVVGSGLGCSVLGLSVVQCRAVQCWLTDPQCGFNIQTFL